MTPDRRTDPGFYDLLTKSYRCLLGRPLIHDPADARRLYEDAPFAVLAHDTSDDPHFIYANRAAQRRFGYDWDLFTALPSRLSAEQPDRAERQRLLDQVKERGFISDYRGVRISRCGERFVIDRATVWQLLDGMGAVQGPAATFALPI